FPVALDTEGWKKVGVEVGSLKLIAGDPEQKLREGSVRMSLGAFDLPRVGALYGIPLADLKKATAVDLDGLVGAGLLYPYRCTFADGGRLLWIEDDNLAEPASAPAPAAAPPVATPPLAAPPLAPSGAPPKGPARDGAA